MSRKALKQGGIRYKKRQVYQCASVIGVHSGLGIICGLAETKVKCIKALRKDRAVVSTSYTDVPHVCVIDISFLLKISTEPTKSTIT
jgi:hypothetical protein